MRHPTNRSLYRGTRDRRRRLGFESLESRRLLAALNHSIDDQIVIEMINRARANPAAEASRLGIELNEGLAPGTISTTPKPPLAPNELLFLAAQGHSQDMVDRDYFDHVNPDGKTPGDRIKAAGYTAAESGENIAEAFSADHFHDSLFESPPHRTNIMRASFREIGVGLVGNGFGLTGTENFARRTGDPFLTGVVFSDQRVGDNFLSYGESLEGITVTAQRPGGPLLSTVTGPSGAFSIQAPAGTYTLRASGPGLEGVMERTNVTVGANNVKVDFVVPYQPPVPDSYEPNESIAQAADIGTGSPFVANLSIHSPVDNDYFRWTSAGAGAVTIELRLPRDGGDVDLIVYDANGTWLGSSETVSSIESVTLPVTAGKQLIIYAFGYGGDIHRSYDLVVQGPAGPAAPAAGPDRVMTLVGVTVDIPILGNDLSPDSPLVPGSVQITQLPAHGQAQWNATSQQLHYSPQAGYRGVDEIRYTVDNADGLTSKETTVRIAVLDPALAPWQNPGQRLDVNGDGEISPVDVAIVINDINANKSRKFAGAVGHRPTSRSLFGREWRRTSLGDRSSADN